MDHPFFLQGEGWVEVAEMGPGAWLIIADGAPMLVKSTEAEGYTATTYNLTVANAHTFFVGEQRIWVHNQNGPCGDGRERLVWPLWRLALWVSYAASAA